MTIKKPHAKNGETYMCFTKDHSPTLAKNRFKRIFGRNPERVFEENWLLWVGPISDDEKVFWYNKGKVTGGANG